MSMEHQLGATEKLPDSPKTIWLAPACNVDERTWCEDDIGECDKCGEPSVKYRRSDLVDAEIERLRAVLKPFSDMAGELFARNWNADAVVTALDNPDDPHRVTAGDYFAARLACVTPHTETAAKRSGNEQRVTGEGEYARL